MAHTHTYTHTDIQTYTHRDPHIHTHKHTYTRTHTDPHTPINISHSSLFSVSYSVVMDVSGSRSGDSDSECVCSVLVTESVEFTCGVAHPEGFSEIRETGKKDREENPTCL